MSSVFFNQHCTSFEFLFTIVSNLISGSNCDKNSQHFCPWAARAKLNHFLIHRFATVRSKMREKKKKERQLRARRSRRTQRGLSISFLSNFQEAHREAEAGANDRGTSVVCSILRSRWPSRSSFSRWNRGSNVSCMRGTRHVVELHARLTKSRGRLRNDSTSSSEVRTSRIVLIRIRARCETSPPGGRSALARTLFLSGLINLFQ